MAMSAQLLEQLAWLREWASDPGALMYVFAPKDRPRLLLFRDDVLAHDTDDKLYAYLCQRFAAAGTSEPDEGP